MTDVTMTPTDNGPYMVEGHVKIVDADRPEYNLSEQTTIFLCRCGGSGTKPSCDGTHEKTNFAAVARPASGSTPISSSAVAS
jgi:CDGSH iron-sulfur domain-containing protein 3